MVSVRRLHEGQWLEVGVYGEEPDARIPPFADAPVDVRSWWPDAAAQGG